MARYAITVVLFRDEMNDRLVGVPSRSCTYSGICGEPEELKIAPNRRIRMIGNARAKKVPTRERRYCLPKAMTSARIRFILLVNDPASAHRQPFALHDASARAP